MNKFYLVGNCLAGVSYNIKEFSSLEETEEYLNNIIYPNDKFGVESGNYGIDCPEEYKGL